MSWLRIPSGNRHGKDTRSWTLEGQPAWGVTVQQLKWMQHHWVGRGLRSPWGLQPFPPPPPPPRWVWPPPSPFPIPLFFTLTPSLTSPGTGKGRSTGCHPAAPDQGPHVTTGAHRWGRSAPRARGPAPVEASDAPPGGRLHTEPERTWDACPSLLLAWGLAVLNDEMMMPLRPALTLISEDLPCRGSGGGIWTELHCSLYLLS